MGEGLLFFSNIMLELKADMAGYACAIESDLRWI